VKNIFRAIARWVHCEPRFCVMVEFVTWWCWRRWRIYCPKGDVSYLFQTKDDFQKSLFDLDEAFVSPCTMNEINCGGFRGKWTPKIKLLGFEMPEGE
jgi:hypothetical protein